MNEEKRKKQKEALIRKEKAELLIDFVVAVSSMITAMAALLKD